MNPANKDYLTERLGFKVHAVEPVSIASGGFHSRIYTCESETGDLILRVCEGWQGWWTSYFPEWVDQQRWVDQAWTVRKAREAGVPAPEIVLTDRTFRWAVSRRLPGVPIDSRYEAWQGCPYDEKEFGTILGRLHSVVPAGWGPIDDLGHALFETWPAFLTAAARSALATARERNALTPELCDQLEVRWIPKLAEANHGRPALLHMESLGFANLLYDPDTKKLTGLLDFEDCIGGDPMFELLWMRFYFEHDDRNQRHFDFTRFARGYQNAESDAGKMPVYRPFPYLDKLRWIDPKGSRAVAYRREIAASI